MTIPVNATDLVLGRRTDRSRLEFLDRWDPERVLRTMCAFANDVDGLDGGYIIVAARTDSGIPVVTGVDRGCLSMRELSEALGYRGVNAKVSRKVAEMMSEGRLEYLYLDIPRSPKQRICTGRKPPGPMNATCQTISIS